MVYVFLFPAFAILMVRFWPKLLVRFWPKVMYTNVYSGFRLFLSNELVCSVFC